MLHVPGADVAAATREIYRLMSGYWIAQAIHVAAQLQIPDLLNAGPQTAGQLARLTSTHEPALYRILRALSYVGIFAETSGGSFVLTPAAECLVSDAPGSMRAYALMMGGQWVWRSCGEMLHSVRTGQSAFEHLFGASEFEFYARNPEVGRISAKGLASRGALEDPAVLGAYDFGHAATVVDVGGGRGTLLSSILKAYPHARGILFDTPEMFDGAKELIAQGNLGNRCDVQAGDFFRSIPSGGDVYIFKKVLHDWNDVRAVEILRVCRKAMPEHGRLLIIEMLLGSEQDDQLINMIDLLMLVYTGGRERTKDEFRNLLAGAGFELRRLIGTGSAVTLLEAIPA